MEDGYDAGKNSRGSYAVAVEELRRRHEAGKVPAKRVEVIGDCTLFLGDCLEILPTLGKVDAVVTDPPYLLTSGGKSPGGMQGGWMTDYDNGGSPVHCDITWHQIMSSVFSALSDHADAYVMANDKNVHEAMNAAKDSGFRFHNLLVWDKGTATANRWYMKNCEFVLYLYKGAAERINDAGSKQLYRVPQIDESIHPTEKPVELMGHYVGNSTHRGETVLDPFLGSGTTGVACAKLGRKFIGIEIEPKYYEIALNRISDAYKQGDMFVERHKKMKQRDLDL